MMQSGRLVTHTTQNFRHNQSRGINIRQYLYPNPYPTRIPPEDDTVVNSVWDASIAERKANHDFVMDADKFDRLSYKLNTNSPEAVDMFGQIESSTRHLRRAVAPSDTFDLFAMADIAQNTILSVSDLLGLHYFGSIMFITCAVRFFTLPWALYDARQNMRRIIIAPQVAKLRADLDFAIANGHYDIAQIKKEEIDALYSKHLLSQSLLGGKTYALCVLSPFLFGMIRGMFGFCAQPHYFPEFALNSSVLWGWVPSLCLPDPTGVVPLINVLCIYGVNRLLIDSHMDYVKRGYHQVLDQLETKRNQAIIKKPNARKTQVLDRLHRYSENYRGLIDDGKLPYYLNTAICTAFVLPSGFFVPTGVLLIGTSNYVISQLTACYVARTLKEDAIYRMGRRTLWESLYD